MENIAPHEIFTDEEKAIAFWESKRWPDGPICPHCGVVGEAYKLQGKSTRPGLWKCKGCRKPFTAKMRSVFEDSHIPMHKWMYAVHLLCSSKKGMSAHQFHRMTGTFYGGKVSYRTAWFMFHRIRYAMAQHPLVEKLTGTIEIDEAFVGGKIRTVPQVQKLGVRPKDRVSPVSNKAVVVSVLQRGGRVQSRHVERVTTENLRPIVDQMIAEDAHVMTDSSTMLKGALKGFKHDQVNHRAEEYVRYENGVCITTNSVEGFFSLLKRGVYGTYHQIGKPYLQQYLNEFDFRYNNRKATDAERTISALKATEGKRLTLRQPRPISPKVT